MIGLICVANAQVSDEFDLLHSAESYALRVRDSITHNKELLLRVKSFEARVATAQDYIRLATSMCTKSTEDGQLQYKSYVNAIHNILDQGAKKTKQDDTRYRMMVGATFNSDGYVLAVPQIQLTTPFYRSYFVDRARNTLDKPLVPGRNMGANDGFGYARTPGHVRGGRRLAGDSSVTPSNGAGANQKARTPTGSAGYALNNNAMVDSWLPQGILGNQNTDASGCIIPACLVPKNSGVFCGPSNPENCMACLGSEINLQASPYMFSYQQAKCVDNSWALKGQIRFFTVYNPRYFLVPHSIATLSQVLGIAGAFAIGNGANEQTFVGLIRQLNQGAFQLFAGLGGGGKLTMTGNTTAEWLHDGTNWANMPYVDPKGTNDLYAFLSFAGCTGTPTIVPHNLPQAGDIDFANTTAFITSFNPLWAGDFEFVVDVATNNATLSDETQLAEIIVGIALEAMLSVVITGSLLCDDQENNIASLETTFDVTANNYEELIYQVFISGNRGFNDQRLCRNWIGTSTCTLSELVDAIYNYYVIDNTLLTLAYSAGLTTVEMLRAQFQEIVNVISDPVGLDGPAKQQLVTKLTDLAAVFQDKEHCSFTENSKMTATANVTEGMAEDQGFYTFTEDGLSIVIDDVAYPAKINFQGATPATLNPRMQSNGDVLSGWKPTIQKCTLTELESDFEGKCSMPCEMSVTLEPASKYGFRMYGVNTSKFDALLDIPVYEKYTQIIDGMLNVVNGSYSDNGRIDPWTGFEMPRVFSHQTMGCTSFDFQARRAMRVSHDYVHDYGLFSQIKENILQPFQSADGARSDYMKNAHSRTLTTAAVVGSLYFMPSLFWDRVMGQTQQKFWIPETLTGTIDKEVITQAFSSQSCEMGTLKQAVCNTDGKINAFLSDVGVQLSYMQTLYSTTAEQLRLVDQQHQKQLAESRQTIQSRQVALNTAIGFRSSATALKNLDIY
jgi:hypothetical protein